MMPRRTKTTKADRRRRPAFLLFKTFIPAARK